MSIKISSKSVLVAALLLAAPMISTATSKKVVRLSHRGSVLKAVKSKSNKAGKYLVNIGGRQFGPMGYDDALKFQSFAANNNVPVRFFGPLPVN